MNVLDNGEDVDNVLLVEGLLCLAVQVVLPQQDLDADHLAEPPQQRHLLDVVQLKHRINRLTARGRSDR